MSHAERWLHSFGHALAAHGLYSPGHQARRQASDKLFASLTAVLRHDARPVFSFLDDVIVYRTLPVHGLREWSWSRRLSAVGIRRLEFSRDVTPDAIQDFLLVLWERMNGSPGRGAALRWPGILAGDVQVESPPAPGEQPAAQASPPIIVLGAEADAMRYVCERVAGGTVPAAEVSGILRGLSVAVHTDGDLLMPLLPRQDGIDEISRHALNTAVLAMTFSEWLGLGATESRSLGMAALLHDIGMIKVEREVWQEPELSASARAGVARHPEDGARLLLSHSPAFELAATTAYEHHLRPDGGGYPARRVSTGVHYISRIVAVCGAYDALRSERAYRPAREAQAALREIEVGAGEVYDSAVAGSFVQMMRAWGGREVSAALG